MSEEISGHVTIVDDDNREVFTFGSQRMTMTNAAGVTVFHFNASDAVLDLGPCFGGAGAAADIRLFGSDGQVKVHINADEGDIRLIGADCAEEFDIHHFDDGDPGSVMTIGPAGRLQSCNQPYDRKVAGVISGAGGLASGIVMDSQTGQRRRVPLALSGKVFCKADADYATIEIGDLLTTSPTPGHAMKVIDSSRAFGAVLGKAMLPLGTGTGLIPVLVALQ